MAIKLSDSVRVGQQKPLEDKYFNELVPYTSTSKVNTLLPKAVRHIGLTVNINGDEYWYKDGIEDSNLILKSNNVDLTNLVPFDGATKNVNIGEHYFESSKGFKITGGTPNQALTANGGVLDLNKKADLGVDGKVPKAQSQPSTMVMNNSTYVITFTDATGAVQTIDLPLESLFKDANYNSSTKSLIVTLQDGTTRTIPLTDLVDLPEIVLATTNPAVTPTTGQKVYFNTSLGKVWFNVSGAWAYAGNLVSDIEKTNFSTAYTHSQTPGNPHGTTKADIGLGNVDNTSDLNKPVSTATQNALNLKVDKVAGKQLSTEDYTTTEKNKLSGIQPGAEANVNADWNATSGDAQILNKPTTFPPSTHTHAVGDITGLQTALDSKQNALTNPVTGTGTTNSLVKFLPDGTVGNSSIFDTETKIGIGLIPISERLEIDGKVLATGFKTSNGAPTKALTSDGNTFDLNKKADLGVDGKVLKDQSQPSTMVMNSSTYVITFTDATGAIQTIDLPLESLFKDANYDESTKSLVITLDNGTTKSIPLSDLVDLPEIVLATTNPSVTPTTGQKVYFNTTLSNVWFNVGGEWVGGHSLINTTTADVKAAISVGAINAGEIVPAGTNIQELVKLIFNKVYYPTFVDPTFSLTNNSINSPKEVGSLANITLTFNFDQGKILGKLDNDIWNPTMLQDYRAGEAISYSLNGVSSNPATVNVLTVLGTNTLNGSVTYGIGAQPKDSKGDNFGNRFLDGESTQSTTFQGIYPYFYYKSTSPITPAIMQSAIANGQATKVVASSTGTITIPFLPSGEYIAVAYPATSTTKTKWYINALDSGDIPGGILGGTNTLPCNSPTGLWNNVNFKIHVSAGVLTQYEAVQLKNS